MDSQNKKLRTAHNSLLQKEDNSEALLAFGDVQHPSAALSKAKKSFKKSNDAFKKIVDAGRDLIGTGSGKVPILLPAP